MNHDKVNLTEGSGGAEMEDLIKSFSIRNRGNWDNSDNDAATFRLDASKELLFTTDSFIVDPIFFPGGNIGHLAFCGTVNDICMMGGVPIGLSVSLVIEEGFPKKDLMTIMDSIKGLSEEYDIPIATGDTKVMEKGKIDKIIINTSAVGISKNLFDKKLEEGDRIIISGGIGEHAVALLSKRFDYETTIVTDSKPLIDEIIKTGSFIKQAKDPTRGGIAAVLNEIAEKNKIGIVLDEEKIPMKKEVKTVTEMLGVDPFELACEGRFICVVKEKDADEALKILKAYNGDASIIGNVAYDNKGKVILKNFLGKRILPKPIGRIVPRIC